MKNEEKSNIIADTQLSKGFVFLQRQARSAEKTIGRCIHGTLTSNSLHSVPGGCVAFELHCFGSTKFHQLYFEDNIHSFFYRWSIDFILPCNNLFFIHFVNSFSCCARLDRSIKRATFDSRGITCGTVCTAGEEDPALVGLFGCAMITGGFDVLAGNSVPALTGLAAAY